MISSSPMVQSAPATEFDDDIDNDMYMKNYKNGGEGTGIQFRDFG
jgi:hypothetical protein